MTALDTAGRGAAFRGGNASDREFPFLRASQLFVTVTLHFYLDALHLALENCHHVKHAAADGHAHHHSGEAEHVVVMDGRGGGPGTSAEMSDILGDSTETWG